MLTQLAHTYGKANLSYYQQAAELDAVARGFTQHKGEHYRRLRNWENLPPYQLERPSFDQSPLIAIPAPDVSLQRMSFTRFKCSGRNAAVLHLAMLIEQTNIQKLMTRILRWYYSRYWGDAYLSQLAADDQETLSPNMTEVGSY